MRRCLPATLVAFGLVAFALGAPARAGEACGTSGAKPDAVIADCTAMLARSGLPDATRARALQDRAEAYDSLDQHDRALADLNESIRLDPRSGDAFYDRASLYRWGFKDIARAFADIEESNRLRPDYHPTLDFRGDLHLERGDLVAATDDYAEVIRLHPTGFSVFDARGKVWLMRGDYRRALDDFEAGIKVAPDYANVVKNRNRARAALALAAALTPEGAGQEPSQEAAKEAGKETGKGARPGGATRGTNKAVGKGTGKDAGKDAGKGTEKRNAVTAAPANFQASEARELWAAIRSWTRDGAFHHCGVEFGDDAASVAVGRGRTGAALALTATAATLTPGTRTPVQVAFGDAAPLSATATAVDPLTLVIPLGAGALERVNDYDARVTIWSAKGLIHAPSLKTSDLGRNLEACFARAGAPVPAASPPATAPEVAPKVAAAEPEPATGGRSGARPGAKPGAKPAAAPTEPAAAAGTPAAAPRIAVVFGILARQAVQQCDVASTKAQRDGIDARLDGLKPARWDGEAEMARLVAQRFPCTVLAGRAELDLEAQLRRFLADTPEAFVAGLPEPLRRDLVAAAENEGTTPTPAPARNGPGTASPPAPAASADGSVGEALFRAPLGPLPQGDALMAHTRDLLAPALPGLTLSLLSNTNAQAFRGEAPGASGMSLRWWEAAGGSAARMQMSAFENELKAGCVNEGILAQRGGTDARVIVYTTRCPDVAPPYRLIWLEAFDNERSRLLLVAMPSASEQTLRGVADRLTAALGMSGGASGTPAAAPAPPATAPGSAASSASTSAPPRAQARPEPGKVVDRAFGPGWLSHVVAHPDGGWVVAGRRFEEDAGSAIVRDQHPLVIRLGADGRVLWEKAFTNRSSAEPQSIAIVPGAGIRVTGYGGLHVATQPIRRLDWIAEIDDAGRVTRDDTVDLKRPKHEGKFIPLTPSTFAFYGSTVLETGEAGLDVIAADARGTRLWQTRVPDVAGFCEGAMLAEPDGGLVAVAGAWTADQTPDGARFRRIDAGGRISGERPLGGFKDACPQAIASVPGGGFIVTGARTEVEGPSGWVALLDREGAIVWERFFGLPDKGVAVGFQAAPGPDGSVVVASCIEAEASEGVVLRYGRTGEPTGERRFPSEAGIAPVAVQVAGDGSIVLAGVLARRCGPISGNVNGGTAWTTILPPESLPAPAR